MSVRVTTRRILTLPSAAALLLCWGVEAVAQVRPPAAGTRPHAATPSAVGDNSNANTLSTGSNRNTNTNTNSNSQFLSGNNTGVNNGSLEVYSGADPYQGIVIEGAGPNLPQLPGFVQTPSNFSQPYKPETFVNGPAFLPAEMTLDQAERCRDSKASWSGGSQEEVASIRLYYTAKQEKPPVPLTMANYVGTAMATSADGPFIATLCEAAHRAMSKGASIGVVEYSIRPKNTMSGIGFGASGGATGLPAAGTHPYAITGVLGFGTGWSTQRVEGEVVLQLTALRESPLSSGSALQPAPSSAAPTNFAPDPEAPPGTPEGGVRTASNRAEAPGAGSILLMSLTAPPVGGGRTAATAAWGAPSASPTARTLAGTLAHHSARTLAGVRSGQSKEHVFDVFAAVVLEVKGRIVEVEGMRLRMWGRSPRDRRVEVSEVILTGRDGTDRPYWFLFEDGRLVAWGPPEQWEAAARRYRLDLPYRPATPPALATTAGREAGQ
jgi:hypothetical protein